MRIGHFLSLCDSTGMLQHAVHSVADRAHGYCVDDNARALLFSSALANSGEAQLVRNDHRALCGIHPARLESGHPPVPEFHELRPPMAGRVGLGRQSRQDALGLGRMRTQGHRSVPPQMGRGAVQDRASRRRGVLVSARLGLLAPGVGRLLRAGRRRRLRQPRAQATGRQVDGRCSPQAETQGLGLVRRRARLRQCAPSAGADPNRPGDRDAGIRRGRPAIAALAHVASDHVIGILQAGRDQELRQAPPEARSVRSAAGRGVGNDFRLPCRVAGGWRRGVAGRGDARVRLVSGRKRPADDADRSRYGQLFGWASSGSAQREQGRRIGAIVSSRSCGDSAVQARCCDRPNETCVQIGHPTRIGTNRTSNDPREHLCPNPNS